MNHFLFGYVTRLQNNVDNNITQTFKEVSHQLKPTLLSLFLIALAVLMFHSRQILFEHLTPLIYFWFSIASFLSGALGFYFIVGQIARLFVALGFGGLMLRSITTFLLKTEKGPLAGTGFLVLLFSFGMRYMNISHG